MTEQLEIYVDTNVLLDWVSPERDNPNSRYLLEKLQSDPGLVGVISTFGLMEAVQNHQDSTFFRSMVNRAYTINEFQAAARNRDLAPADCSRCYDDVLGVVRSLGKKALLRPLDSGEIWTEAVHLLRTSNISAPDAIHVGVATASQCDLFATSDTQLFEHLKARVRTGNRPVGVLTNKSQKSANFRSGFDSLVSRIRARRAHRPKKRVPQEFRRFVGALGPIIGSGTDPKEFQAEYERKLRRTGPR